MARFTPGEWQVEHGRSHNPMVGTAEVTIAEVLDDVFPDTAQQHANAYLIASAPCLLAALAEFVRLSDDPEATAEQWGRAKLAAQTAINAATGAES
jgi:hypothetical protein